MHEPAWVVANLAGRRGRLQRLESAAGSVRGTAGHRCPWRRGGAGELDDAALELLELPERSRTRQLGMLTLGGYLVIAVLMLIVKAVEVSLGH
jgi:hypothetical protein